jgi:hypothetical protein
MVFILDLLNMTLFPIPYYCSRGIRGGRGKESSTRPSTNVTIVFCCTLLILTLLNLAQVRNDLQMGRLPPVQPFHAMAYPFSAELALAISQKYAQFCAVTASRMRPPQLSHPAARPLARGERLRVAYVSSDFGNHPLSHLMGSVFGLHDRSKVWRTFPLPWRLLLSFGHISPRLC